MWSAKSMFGRELRTPEDMNFPCKGCEKSLQKVVGKYHCRVVRNWGKKRVLCAIPVTIIPNITSSHGPH